MPDGFFFKDLPSRKLKHKYLAKSREYYVPIEGNEPELEKLGMLEKEQKIQLPNVDLPEMLYSSQKESIKFCIATDGNCIIADDMGLGKTLVGIYFAQHTRKKILIVGQASLKVQWQKEIENWSTLSSYIVYGQSYVKFPVVDCIIINYEILQYHMEEIIAYGFDQIIVDEIQFFGNYDSLRTKLLIKLAQIIGHIIALSGTPITRRPVQFYPILHILLPEIAPSFAKFTKLYCEPKLTPHGWKYDGATNIEQLRRHLQKVMIRHRKEDVLDLPEFKIIPLTFSMEPELLLAYKEDEARMVKDVFGKGNYLKDKEAITYLQYLAYIGKRKSMLQWIADYLQTGEKLAIFCVHRKIVEDIHEEFKDDSVVYYGGLTEKQRAKAKHTFLNKKQIIIGNITSMGIGLDGLQHVCDTALFVELPWTPTMFDQARDRLWRSGQQNYVRIYVMLSQNTIEEQVIQVLDKSRTIVDDLVEGKQQNPLLHEVIKNVKNKY